MRLAAILSAFAGFAFLAATRKGGEDAELGAGLQLQNGLPVIKSGLELKTLGDTQAPKTGLASTLSQFFNSALPRGIRNNNPGNIEKSSSPWQGKTSGPDTRFEAFKTPEDGIRAVGKVLVNYQALYGLNTIFGLISRYAPSTENNTEAYAAAVAARLGVGINDPIDVKENLAELLPAIIQHENGMQPYSSEQIAAAIARV